MMFPYHYICFEDPLGRKGHLHAYEPNLAATPPYLPSTQIVAAQGRECHILYTALHCTLMSGLLQIRKSFLETRWDTLQNCKPHLLYQLGSFTRRYEYQSVESPVLDLSKFYVHKILLEHKAELPQIRE